MNNDKSHLVLKGERLDDLQRNNLMLIQNPNMFCFGVDAVLLSSFAKIKKHDNVLDLCTGNGIIPILLTGKSEGKSFTGMDILKNNIDMANRSVLYNDLSEKVSFVNDDIKNIKNHFKPKTFEVVTCNPPYVKENSGLRNDVDEMTIARHEIYCTLEDCIKTADYSLKFGGRFYMIHRPTRIAEIFSLLTKYNFEPKTMQLVYPKLHKKPTMVLICATSFGKPMLEVLPPLIMYDDNNEYTQDIVNLQNN